jgi:hypothetical protein
VLGVVALLAALALLFAGFAFSRLWNFGDRGGRDLTFGALMALLVLAPYGVAAYWTLSYPPLKDVSTDLDDLPVLAGATQRTPDMNALAPLTPGERRMQEESYPQVAGRRYDLPFDGVVDAIETVLDRRGWQLTGPFPEVAGQGQITIDAVAASFILGLPADVAVRAAQDGDSTFVDMRSASRYGRQDLGDNAARIIAFLAELDQEIAGKMGTAPAQ